MSENAQCVLVSEPNKGYNRDSDSKGSICNSGDKRDNVKLECYCVQDNGDCIEDNVEVNNRDNVEIIIHNKEDEGDDMEDNIEDRGNDEKVDDIEDKRDNIKFELVDIKLQDEIKDVAHSVQSKEYYVEDITVTAVTKRGQRKNPDTPRVSRRLQSRSSAKTSQDGTVNTNSRSRRDKVMKSGQQKKEGTEINDKSKLSVTENKVSYPKSIQSKQKSKRQTRSTHDQEINDDGDDDWIPKSSKKQSKHVTIKNRSNSASKKKRSFKCNQCNKTMQSATELKMHKLQHDSFKCKYCGICFRTQLGLTKHEGRHIGATLSKKSQTYNCKHCGIQWVRKHYYEKHEKLCAGPHMCEYCNTVLANLRLLRNHKRRACPARKTEYNKNKKICSYCGILVGRSRMNDHLNIHTGATPHMCTLCSKPFRTRRTLRRHEALHKKIGVNLGDAYRCKYCNKTCKSELFLDFHEKRHQGESPYQCSLCPSSFFFVNQFYEHQRSHQGKQSSQCKICNKSYRNDRCLKRHLRTHTRQDAVQCPECFKMFSTPGNLKLHQRIHTKEVQFPCKHCDRVFVQKSHLQYHEQSHSERVMYECPQCDRKFTTSYYRDLHLRMAHTKQDLPACPHCGKMFQNRSLLKRHILSTCAPDTVEENLYCKYCCEQVKNTLHLDEHIRKYHKEYDFTCKLCGYEATKSSSLRTHMRRHTGERPYNCHYCDRSFKQNTTLKNHERLHTGEKPYQCHICPKAFVQKYNLTCHIRVHTGDRPWSCKHCDKGFTQQSSYKSHQEKCGKGSLRTPKTPSKKPAKQKQQISSDKVVEDDVALKISQETRRDVVSDAEAQDQAVIEKVVPEVSVKEEVHVMFNSETTGEVTITADVLNAIALLKDHLQA